MHIGLGHGRTEHYWDRSCLNAKCMFTHEIPRLLPESNTQILHPNDVGLPVEGRLMLYSSFPEDFPTPVVSKAYP